MPESKTTPDEAFVKKMRTDGFIKALELAGVDGFTKDIVKLNLDNADLRSQVKKLTSVIEMCIDCIGGETPEDCSPGEAEDFVVQKCREAIGV
jgi:hypothetical protein